MALKPKVRPKLSDHLTDSLTQFDSIIVAVQEERATALQDRRFAFIAGAQWEDEWGEQFANVPMVEINKTAAGLDKIINDYRANRLTVNFRPTDDKASEDTADMLDGLFRADAYRSKAQQALDNAFEEGAAGGYGGWRVTNEFEDEFDPDNEFQRIRTMAIMDADQSIFWDPNAQLYDKSDAKYCFVITAMARAAFEEEYPKASCVDFPDAGFKLHYDWFTPDVIRVAEKYEVEIKSETLRKFSNAITGETQRFWESELSDEDAEDLITQGWTEEESRKVKRRRIAKTVMSGAEILKARKIIAGDCIPVVPYYGQRRFIDNMERAMGHVRKAKDGQRTYNTMISKMVETASLSPQERPIFTPQQIAGHETSWAEANINRAPYSLINPLIDERDGSIIQTQQVGMITPQQISPAIVGLIQIASADIENLTNAVDGADVAQANLSAEAMDIAATRTDAKSAIYMDNMKQSVQRWGEIWLGMAKEIYVEEGRRVETLGEGGEDGEAILVEPHTDESGKYSIRNDLARGKYKVISDVTEATATRRDKTSKTLVNVAQIAAATDPALAAAALNTALLNMDGEGMNDLQAWIRERLVQQGVVKPTDEEKRQMEEAAANQQPDPQAQALQAVAQKEGALAVKAVADTKLSEAKVVQTLADAALKGVQAGKTEEEAKHVGDAMQAANDTIPEGRPMPSPAANRPAA